MRKKSFLACMIHTLVTKKNLRTSARYLRYLRIKMRPLTGVYPEMVFRRDDR